MKRIVRYFLQGLIFVVPIALTAWLFYASFRTIDGWLGLPIPGAGVAAVLIAVTIFGVLASNFLTRRILSAFEGLLDRLPFVRLLHTSMKDLMGAFVGEKKRFDKPVMVDLAPGGHVRALGFITRQTMAHYQLPDAVAVYFPQAYNFAGQVVIVPRSAVRELELESSEVMAFIVSGGIAGK